MLCEIAIANSHAMSVSLERKVSRIKLLDIPEARRDAYHVLTVPGKFECVKADSDFVESTFPETVREIFSKYYSIKSVAGEAYLSRDVVGPAEYGSGLWRIGTNMDFTEIVVRPNADDVYEIDGSEKSEAALSSSRLPTIFHWILVTDATLYGKNSE
jgi:hypothetical protein